MLSLFPNNSDLFGAYGVGLGVGFFAYFVIVVAMVKVAVVAVRRLRAWRLGR